MQVGDVQWARGVVGERWGGARVFLMGHSMVRCARCLFGLGEADERGVQGGGVVLKYCTATKDPQFAGVLVSSPLLHQAKPAPRALRAVGSIAGRLLPYKTFPAEVKPEVRFQCTVAEFRIGVDGWNRK